MHYVITGAAQGIGAALAGKLSGEGHELTLLDLKEPDAALGTFIRVDLSDPAQIDAALAQLDSPFDGLCNSAGLPPRPGNATKLLEVNFFGLRQFTLGLLPKLRPGSGIANLASRAGHAWRDHLDQTMRLSAAGFGGAAQFVTDEGIDATRAYNLSKEAVILWGFAMAEEMIARDLRMNAICPSAVDTGILTDFMTAFGKAVESNLARTGRPGSPDEIADIAAFLLSPASRWLNAVELTADRGMSGFVVSDRLQLSDLKGI